MTLYLKKGLNTAMSGKPTTISFTVESSILRELGEQLVSDVSVALTELIKNSYDADSSYCDLSISDSKVVISDDGTGMTFSEFKNKWMSISTSNKSKEKTSKKYKRKFTGSKGIGRFAVRFIGSKLVLNTCGLNSATKKYEKITATFDWALLDKSKTLSEIEVPYKLEILNKAKTGTILEIHKPKQVIDYSTIKKVRTGVMNVASPLGALLQEAPPDVLNSILRGDSRDPGFSINIKDASDPSDEYSGVSEKIISSANISLSLRLTGEQVHVRLRHKTHGKLLDKVFKYSNHIKTDLFITVHHFPRRGGMFRDADVDGREVWTWVRENSGMRIYDHGFGVSPYGYAENDWLEIDVDKAQSKRNAWKSRLMQKHFFMTPEEISNPGLNPMLYLPANYSVIGGIFLRSTTPQSTGDRSGIIPSMDRQGFIENDAFDDLQDISRFCLELIARFDKKVQTEEKEQKRKEKSALLKKEIKEVIKEINSSPGLNSDDKKRIAGYYEDLSKNIGELESYDRDSRQHLEVMSLLGVIAGFMTHEHKVALMELEKASDILAELSKKNPELKEPSKQIKKSIDAFVGYVDYTKTFVANLHLDKQPEYKLLPQIKSVVGIFEKYIEGHDIEVDLDDIPRDLKGPNISLALLRGVLHNLYTNSIKAILQNSRNHDRRVRFIAWREGDKFYIRIMDTGVGISPHVQTRIWDPLYTTTSDENNPLGSGMGLGLPLVKRSLEAVKGKISLIRAPEGYSTCFEVMINDGNLK